MEVDLYTDLDDGNHEEFKLEIQRFIRVVVHQQKCRDPNCSISNCQLVKEVFLHLRRCKVRADDCSFCKRVITAISYHARHCKDAKCVVPGCLQKRYRLQQGLQRNHSLLGCVRVSSNSALGVPSSPAAVSSSLLHNRRGLQTPLQTLQPIQMVSGGLVKRRFDKPEYGSTSGGVSCFNLDFLKRCLKRCLKQLFKR